MKTINKQIDIFNTEESATRAFNASPVPCDLLYSKSYKAWYLDRDKNAIIEWPNLYTLINSK